MLSIESQKNELERAFAGAPELEIVDVYHESFSAKAPGRPLFDEMLARIERGEAEGIVAWHPDRLARNSIDGGRIIYLLDQKCLRDLKFATFTFENNPQGKFMLSIIFGYSKYYVDSLSENVKRGNRTKVQNGWRPNMAPLGYLNDKASKTIVKDPVLFPMIRHIYELMLTGVYSPRRIVFMSRHEWGFRTPRRPRSGGRPLGLSTIYRILTNPFYAGIIVWEAQTYVGKHEPVVSLDEFERVQGLLGRPGRPKPKRHTFAFTGMIRCSACGLMVTAEHKVNRFGSQYVYYHCTRRRLEPRCRQPSIEEKALEGQIVEFLRRITIPEPIHAWLLTELETMGVQEEERERASVRSLEKAAAEVAQQLAELTGLRLRNLLTDDEFLRTRQKLQREQLQLQGRLSRMAIGPRRFEPVEDVVLFRKHAPFWFREGDRDVKRLIVETVGSNLTLEDKKLRIEAKKPLLEVAGIDDRPRLLAVVEDVRTLVDSGDEVFARALDNIRMLRRMFGMERAAQAG